MVVSTQHERMSSPQLCNLLCLPCVPPSSCSLSLCFTFPMLCLSYALSCLCFIFPLLYYPLLYFTYTLLSYTVPSPCYIFPILYFPYVFTILMLYVPYAFSFLYLPFPPSLCFNFLSVCLCFALCIPPYVLPFYIFFPYILPSLGFTFPSCLLPCLFVLSSLCFANIGSLSILHI